MQSRRSLSVFVLLLLLIPVRAQAGADFQLVDGDRVVLIGSTLIEREQTYGHWETLLASRYPDRNTIFRNLGWSGDTVFGDGRAAFGTAADGFQHLKDQVFEAKPTIIFVAYGSNESFAGEAGLPHFREGLNTLLDVLAPTKARMVILSPPPQEDLGPPLPDPAEHNRNIMLYRDALRTVSEKRGYPFIDLYDLVNPLMKGDKSSKLTDNGIHLTAFGYWKTAPVIEQGLGWTPRRWLVELGKDGQPIIAEGARVTGARAFPLKFQVTDAMLPAAPAPGGSINPASLPGGERVLRIQGLAAGTYSLRIDGKSVAQASAGEWAAGVKLVRGPEFEQADALRAAIIDKNRLYFHRWRPENETYLFGFRKHEQGQNAREIPQFDPLVDNLEKEIARLRVPVVQQYELVPEQEVKK